jgi:hypothetical protein
MIQRATIPFDAFRVWDRKIELLHRGEVVLSKDYFADFRRGDTITLEGVDGEVDCEYAEAAQFQLTQLGGKP